VLAGRLHHWLGLSSHTGEISREGLGQFYCAVRFNLIINSNLSLIFKKILEASHSFAPEQPLGLVQIIQLIGGLNRIGLKQEII
jgi:hypothetical protein